MERGSNANKLITATENTTRLSYEGRFNFQWLGFFLLVAWIYQFSFCYIYFAKWCAKKKKNYNLLYR